MKQHIEKKLTKSRQTGKNILIDRFFLFLCEKNAFLWKKLPILGLFLFLISILTGCASDVFSSAIKSIGSLKSSPVWLNSVSFKTSDKVNDFSPVLVHIVIPYSQDLYQELIKMNANDYFKKMDQLRLDNAEKMDVFEWELVRSQTIEDDQIKPSKFSGEGILVFANYSTPGPHRANVGEDEKILITLNDDDFTITSKKQ